MAFCSTIKQAKYADYKTSSEKDTFETLNLHVANSSLILHFASLYTYNTTKIYLCAQYKQYTQN